MSSAITRFAASGSVQHRFLMLPGPESRLGNARYRCWAPARQLSRSTQASMHAGRQRPARRSECVEVERGVNCARQLGLLILAHSADLLAQGGGRNRCDVVACDDALVF